MYRRTFASFACSLGLFGCTPSAGTGVEPINAPTLPHYDLAISFDLDAARLMVDGILTLPAASQPSSSWEFELAPRMQARAPLRVRCGNRGLPVAELSNIGKTKYQDLVWRATTREPCSGAPVQLIFSYQTTETASPQLRLEKDRGYAGSDGELWYPRLSAPPLHTARTTLNLPAGATGIATGRLVRAASTRGGSRLVFETQSPAKVAFAFGPYRDVGFKDPFPLTVLTMQSPATADKLAQGFAAGIAPLLSAFGPFPKPSLTIVEIDFKSSLLGIAEFGRTFADTTKFQGEFDMPYWTHEFAHEWWGNSVRPDKDSPGAALLTEGLAQYAALLALETVKGAEAAAAYRKTARRHSLQAYSKLLDEGKDRPLVGPTPIGQEQVLLGHNLATAKGAVLLDQLSRMIGRDRFHALLRSFYEANAGRTTSWVALEAHINAGTNNAYRWWFEQWLHKPGAPDFSVDHSIDGDKVRVQVTQKGQPYRLTLPVEVSGAWGRDRFDIALSGPSATAEFRSRGPVQTLVLDPDGLVPRRNFKP